MPIVQPGLSVGCAGGDEGTLGLLVRRRNDPAVYGLSCAHVLAILSVDLADGNKFALAEHQRIIEQPWMSRLPSRRSDHRVGSLTNWYSEISKTGVTRLDAALFELDGAPRIERRADIAGLGPPRGWLREVHYGSMIRLRGVGSGQVVSGNILPKELQMPEKIEELTLPGFGRHRFKFTGLLKHNAPVSPGDSGAVMLEEGTDLVAGIIVAKGLFYPIHEVFNRFDLDLYLG